MALTEYILPNCDSPAGVFTIKLYSEFAGLTVPTRQTILSIGDTDDSVDKSPSVQEASTLEIGIADDTSTYAEGFWFKAFGGEALLKIMLMEGATETYYFFGAVDPLQVEWTDHYVNASNTEFVRSASVVLTSLVAKIFSSTADELLDEAYSHRIPNSSPNPSTNGAIWSIIRIRDIIACMLKTSGLNDTYSAEDVSFVCDRSNPDFKYIDGSTREYLFDELFIHASISSDIGEEVRSNLFYMRSRFYLLKDLVSAYLNSFQLILRFDFVGVRIRINLMQRGRSSSVSVTMPKPIARTIKMSSDLRVDGVRVYDYIDQSHTWISLNLSSAILSIDVPNYISIDTEIASMFRAGMDDAALSASAFSSPLRGHTIFGIAGLDEYETPIYPDLNWGDRIRAISYYNYESGEYDTTQTNSLDLQEAVCGYVFHKFAPMFRVIEATYATMKVNDGSTTSQANAVALMRTSINDGSGAKQFYATRVVKNPELNQLQVTWFEE